MPGLDLFLRLCAVDSRREGVGLILFFRRRFRRTEPFGERPSVPNVVTSGRPDPLKAAPIVSMARRSASAETARNRETMLVGSPPKIMRRRCPNGICDRACIHARGITASAAAASLRRLSVSSRLPRCGWTPLADNFFPASSDRARAVTECPAPISSSTTADPMNPVAPVTKTRI